MKFSISSVHSVISLLLLSSMLFSPTVNAESIVSVEGYLMDLQCIGLCEEAAPFAGCTPDGSNAFYSPQAHTGWCKLLPVCEQSGYVLMSEFPVENDGRHEILFKLAGDASQNVTASFIRKGTRDAFPKVRVTYDEDLATMDFDVKVGGGTEEFLHVFDATVADPWEGNEEIYSGSATTQMLCDDSSAPDKETNNMCFRSDVMISSFESNGQNHTVIESSGCPTHQNMQGSNGTISNGQDISFFIEGTAMPNQGCSACGLCAAPCGCGSGGCGLCGSSCGSDLGSACGSSCGSSCGSTCGSACGICSACGSGCWAEGCQAGCHAGCDAAHSCGAEACAATDAGCHAGCDAAHSCGAEACAATDAGCHAGCDAAHSCGAEACAATDEEPTRGTTYHGIWGMRNLADCGVDPCSAKPCGALCGASSPCAADQCGASSPCAADPCGALCGACSPCAAEPCGALCGACSPCAADPCGAQCGASSPCAANPCGASCGASSPCAADPCGAQCGACSPCAADPCGAQCGACSPCAADPCGACSPCSAHSGPTTMAVEGVPISFTYELGSDNETGQATMAGEVVYEGLGWVGFAVSEAGMMVGSEAIIGLPDEEMSASNPGKYSLGAYSVPGVVLSEQQTLLESSISQNETHTVLTFTKFLEEEGELAISATGSNSFLVAAGSSNTLGYHAVRQPFEVTLGWTDAGSGCDGGCGVCGGGCGGCGGGCGCGGCGASAEKPEESHGVLGIYDPTFQHYTMIIPSDPGTPGDAKPMGDDVVGILTNGVLLDSHQQTFAYDSCNGHSDKKHQYHYHIPPICLLQDMGVAFADSHTWWINDLGNETRPWEDMAAQFPETSPSSPVLGFARDGFPIFGPYDDAGNLQRGASFGGDLDECNGKTDSNGNYGYYFTVDPPFAPVCLRGEIGNFAYSSTNIKCPKEGISNDILVDMDADMDMNTTTAVGKTTEDIDVDDEKAAEADREDLFLGSGATSMTASFTFALMAALLFV